MANINSLAFSSLVVISFLAVAVSAEYRFNGLRGSIIPNKPSDDKDHTNEVPSTEGNTIHQNNYNNNNNNKDETDISDRRCVQQSFKDFRPVSGSCTKFMMCSNNVLITFHCPDTTVFSQEIKSCVPKGTRFDTCQDKEETIVPNVLVPVAVRPLPISQTTTLCPRGATYKKAHPVHCARYYDCSKPAMMSRWADHEWECKYPFLFNEDTNRCEHYSMVSCGSRKIAYDRCEYKQYSCNGHSHCRPCEVENPSCRGLPNGMNVWQGRTPSPYYVVCADNRVVYSGTCPGGQIFDGKTGTCVIIKTDSPYW